MKGSVSFLGGRSRFGLRRGTADYDGIRWQSYDNGRIDDPVIHFRKRARFMTQRRAPLKCSGLRWHADGTFNFINLDSERTQ
ncbi:hypothetical protein [Caballeronia catudaia]|uniref:hypothetical protein n=1 Tax=Caballeronia catudaia TaxID=1777136 RepID=UPI00117E4A32|nr:hypothetical protein [Caballeronia catudaia]